jgi:hypothetical protein
MRGRDGRRMAAARERPAVSKINYEITSSRDQNGLETNLGVH